MEFVYPQIVTGADLLRGINKLNYTAPLLARRGAVAASIVNSSMMGVPSFYKTMKKYHIQPVIGLSVYVEIEEGQSVLVYVYARNNDGYQQLLKMSSAVSITANETLPLKWFQAYRKNCLCICPLTDPSWSDTIYEEVLELFSKTQADDFICIGIARPFGVKHSQEADFEKIAQQFNMQIVAVYESRYLDAKDVFAYDVATAIRLGEKLNPKDSTRHQHPFTHLPEKQEVQQWFHDRPEWLVNISDHILACKVDFVEPHKIMPSFPVKTNQNADQLLKEHCYTGLKKRVQTVSKVYEQRLLYELSVIEEMEFADYFLIVEDFMRYARGQNILTGPGRGSSAGSLVAYSLHITDVDPIQYGLIFERFLNPERITLPDIDIDFEDQRRMEVIEYVGRKYGKNHVAQIGTFGTLTAKAVARNVGRVYDFTNDEMSFVSTLIGDQQGITLAEVYKQNPKFRDWIEQHQVRKKWYQACLLLEGLPRNTSTHAAGIVLSPRPLVEDVPLKNGEGHLYVTQWAMGDVEERGLLKIDFLGLRNLTMLERIRKMIAFDQPSPLNFEHIPFNDTETFKVFQDGETTGIFQFESPGMRETLRLISPSNFEELFAINALYRPGPMDYISSYARRKKGQESVQYIHPALEPILQDTYGIIVYQEQIIQILVQLANYSMGEADLVRRAISKKNHQTLKQEQSKFMAHAVENGIPFHSAKEIFSLIIKFADYGFPKSHAVAYSMISYQLAYLKAHYPAYFYAALLESSIGNEEKTSEMLAEARTKGVEVLRPSIQSSKYLHTVENGAIRIGFRSIKGLPLQFYQRLKHVRSEKSISHLFEFAELMGEKLFTEKSLQALIKAGALDDFGKHRGQLLASIIPAIDHVKFIAPDDEQDILTQEMHAVASPKYADASEMTMMEKLTFEKEVLGFYISDHPALAVKKEIHAQFPAIIDVHKFKRNKKVQMLGLVLSIKKIRTKKGEAMAFVKLQDESGTISCTVFPKQYAQYSAILNEMELCIVEGKVEIRGNVHQVIVEKVLLNESRD